MIQQSLDDRADSKAPDLSVPLQRNIKTMVTLREQTERRKSLQDRIADQITRFTGSMFFVYLHLTWFISWVVINLGLVGLEPFDPYPFGLLTMIGSLEAIFLSTFVLISQNRMMAVSDRRAELDLQIDLLAEHEITQLVKLTDAIALHLGVRTTHEPEVEAAKYDVDPAMVFAAIEAHLNAPADKESTQAGDGAVAS